MLFNKKFDLVISLGEDCATAGYLNNLSLRIFSSPFDWVNGSDICKRLKLIENHFENWLNEKYIELLSGEGAANPIEYIKLHPNTSPNDVHESYINTFTGIKFHHDFIYKVPFEKNIKQVKEKYNRRITRFLKSIEKADKVCLVYLAKNNANIVECQECINSLNAKYKNKFHLLYIENNNTLAPCDTIIKKTQNMTYAQINNISVDCSSDFTKLMGNIPVVERIILNTVFEFNISKLIKYTKNKTCMLYKILKFFIKLVPNKNLRISLREDLKIHFFKDNL